MKKREYKLMRCDLRWGAALVLSGVLGLLSACGGSGFSPAVTGVQVQTLQYGRTASIYVGGNDLRSTMVADLGPGCTSPAFSSNSSTTLALLTCNVTAVGTLPLTIKSAAGQVLYQTSLTVPKPQVVLANGQSSVTLELDPAAAPVTVDNFLAYVKQGFYKDTLIHRVIKGFVIQGGGYTTGMVKKTGQTAAIALESNNGLSNLRGTVAMARTSDPNSATSEFFINLVDNTSLDYVSASSPGYAVFGKVISGMDVVDAIALQPTGSVSGFSDVPLSDVTVTSVTQIK
jgi:peptidyl-prolyl cis-trans isomerase A (cyclophilin A)